MQCRPAQKGNTEMTDEKKIAKYRKLYEAGLKKEGFGDYRQKGRAYEARLKEMYASDIFRKHNQYPTTNTEHIYAVIAMCLELRDMGYDRQQIIAFTDVVFQKRKKAFEILEKIIDLLPGAWEIARRWNISDHDKRVKDGSITYDVFNVQPDRIEYRISHCMYIEMFEHFGIRPLCKLFCRTDESAYANLTRHVRFVRHSDLSEGDLCWDEIYRK